MSAAAPPFTDLSQLSLQDRDYRSLTASVNDVLIERGRLVASNDVLRKAAVQLRRICAEMALSRVDGAPRAAVAIHSRGRFAARFAGGKCGQQKR
jgi:hypothetical protein